MHFTYSEYVRLLELLDKNGYSFCNYHDNFSDNGKYVILRHDIDTDPLKAFKMAELEKQSLGIQSTYYVLLTSDLYNTFSNNTRTIFNKIIDNGHEIGLHFDEMAYPDLVGDEVRVKEKIIEEANILSEIIGCKVTSFSYHRPSKKILDSQIEIEGMINSYSNFFFHEFKYLSDSRRRWREPVDDIINCGEYRKLHILTHAFWYGDEEKDIHDTITNFVRKANIDRYKILEDNISDLQSIVSLKDIYNNSKKANCARKD